MRWYDAESMLGIRKRPPSVWLLSHNICSAICCSFKGPTDADAEGAEEKDVSIAEWSREGVVGVVGVLVGDGVWWRVSGGEGGVEYEYPVDGEGCLE